MENSFAKMYELIESDQNCSERSQKRDFKARLNELFEEVEEIKTALEKNDLDNIKEEMGDAFWDLSYAIFMAEKEGIFKTDEIVEGVIKKIKRRKPWATEGKKISKEEEFKIWNEIKKREKAGEFD